MSHYVDGFVVPVPRNKVDDYRKMQSRVGLQRTIIVQPVTYGFDNLCTLDSVAQFGDNARAVVTVPTDITERELDDLWQTGARGLRYHQMRGSVTEWSDLPIMAERIRGTGWHLQIQFDGIEFRQVTVPFIATVDKAIEAVRKIDLVGAQEGMRPIIFSTLVQEDVRNVVRGSTGFFLDFFDPFLAPLAAELKTQSIHTVSRTHRMADAHAYAMRIDATNFALANDDGSVVRDYERADVILIGVSRSGKTMFG